MILSFDFADLSVHYVAVSPELLQHGEHPEADIVRGGMLKDTEVGVESCCLVFKHLGSLECEAEAGDPTAGRLYLLQVLLETADCPVRCVYPLRLDHAADDSHPLPCLLYVYLVRMQIHVELCLQGEADHDNRSGDVFLSVADDSHVIDKTHILAPEASHDPQDNTIKDREEEGAEQLRGDIADGHTSIRRGVEPALVRIEKLPQVKPSTPFAILFGDVHQGHFRKP